MRDQELQDLRHKIDCRTVLDALASAALRFEPSRNSAKSNRGGASMSREPPPCTAPRRPALYSRA